MANPKDSNYKIKPFMLNLDNPEEKELYEWLKTQKGRRFKQETLAYWLKQMRKESEITDEIRDRKV